MKGVTTEVFFLPEPIRRESTQIPAALYNRCRLLLSRCAEPHVFVPIRSMQYLGVIDAEEVIFVDSQAYAVRGGVGGRMIMLSWRFIAAGSRDSLHEPVPIEVLCHHPRAMELRTRLRGEFDKALALLEGKQRDQGCAPRRKKVVPFPPAGSDS
jgi:hypothetical protein